jgi:hypothetical protein
MIPSFPSLATLPGQLKCLLTVLTTAKILSTAVLVSLGDYRAERISPFRRVAGLTTKITPPLMALVAGWLEIVLGNPRAGWLLVAISPLIAGFAAFVLGLRGRRKFFGAADWFERYLPPVQVKAGLLVFLSVLLLLVLRNR